jgi:hypothetical protein
LERWEFPSRRNYGGDPAIVKAYRIALNWGFYVVQRNFRTRMTAAAIHSLANAP